MSMNSPLLTDILHIESLADNSKLLWHSPQLHSPTDASAPDWSILAPSTTMNFMSSSGSGGGCIPGGLAQISALSPSPSRSPSPALPSNQGLGITTISLDSLHSQDMQNLSAKTGQKVATAAGTALANPHPYSISPSNTTALFTRASSVSSSSGGSAPPKKSRAPPSGPISTKDFIPPDVSGLSKREARLVKNRAAAFLSRQRKREEFEGLESRVDQLEAENARLRASQGTSSQHIVTATSQDFANLKAQHAQELAALHASYSGQINTLNNDVQSVKLQLDTATQTHEANEAKLRAEVDQLKEQLNQRQQNDDDSDSSSEDGEEESESKKSRNGPGSVALMVLLFSLSNLLTNNANGRKSAATTTTPGTSTAEPTTNQPRRISHQARRSSTSHFLPSYTASSSMARQSPYASGSFPYEGLSSGFGFEYDATEPFSIESLLNTPPSHHSFGTGIVDDDFSMMEELLVKSPKMMTTSMLDDEDDFLTSSSAGSPGASSVSTIVPPRDDASASLGISGIVPTGPGSFEFDFMVPSSVSSTSTSASKIKVSVKSKPSSTVGSLRPGDVMESPVKFQPDDLDSMTFGGNSWSFPSQESGSKKRKLVLEVKPTQSSSGGSKKRRMADFGEQWEVVVSSGDDSQRTQQDVKMEVEI